MPKKVPSLLLLICLVGFPQISETIYTPALPDLSVGLDATDNQIQLTLSIYFIGFALGVYFWGRLSDSLGRRPTMLLGIFAYIVGSLGCLFASYVGLLLFFRFIQSFGASVGSVITQTILRESIPLARRNEVFAKISAALASTPAIGPFIGGWANQILGYSSIFVILIAMGILIFVYTYVSLPETRDPATLEDINTFKVFRRMICDPKIWSFTILIGISNGIIFSYYAEAPFLFMNYFGMTSGSYGLLGIVVACASIVGSMLSKKLLVVYPPEKIILLGSFITFVGALIFGLLVASLNFSSTILLFGLILIPVFILLLGIGMAIPNCLSLALNRYGQVLGTAGAILGLKYYLLVSLITSGMSYLHNESITVMPYYFIILSLIMLTTSMGIRKFESNTL